MEASKFLEFEEVQRTAYLTALSTLALSDGEVDDEEAELIEQMCKEAQLSFPAKLKVLNALYTPDDVDVETQMIHLKENDLKFYLAADVLTLVKADGEFTPDEIKDVAILKAQLALSNDQYEAINKYVDMTSQLTTEGITGDFLQKAGLDKKFADLGIPVDTFSAGTTVGQALGKAALGVASKQLEGTELGKALEIGKAVGGVFAGILQNKKKKNKKKKKGFLGKLLGKKINKQDPSATE